MIEEINEIKNWFTINKIDKFVTCIVKKNKGRTYKLPISEIKETLLQIPQTLKRIRG